MTPNQRNETETAAAEMRSKFSLRELRELFISKERDSSFEHIGRLALDRLAPPHIYVWAGYEIVIGSKWSIFNAPDGDLRDEDDGTES